MTEIGYWPAPSNPMAVARELLTSLQTADGKLTLRRWRGAWMRWSGTCWAEVEDTAVRRGIYTKLEHAQYKTTDGAVKEWAPNKTKVANVMEAFAAITHLPEDVDAPAWIGKARPAPAGEIVACANGLLHVGTRELIGHTPDYFNTVAVPFDYDPDAPKPERWLAFLKELWTDDPDSIATLQEWFGYVLSGRTDQHKILLQVGPTRGGKGTIARVQGALIGKGNVAGPTLASLASNFGLMPLIGKPLAIIADARSGGPNSHHVVEKLLSISGEDLQTVDRKFKEPWTGKLPTRFMLLSNELPRFGDASGAISGRFIILITTVSFLGRENSKLTGELLTELPGILRWSLEGLDRMARNDALTEPQASADARATLQDMVSPVSAFVRQKCDRRGEVLCSELFEQWRAWCDVNGHRAGSAQTFGKDVRAAVPLVHVVQHRDEEGREPRYYSGLSLKNEAHSAQGRVSPRVSDSDDGLTRGDTRPEPLSAQQQEPCPRHTRFGGHPHCPDCQGAAK
jgi:putative DNA primase/helicase